MDKREKDKLIEDATALVKERLVQEEAANTDIAPAETIERVIAAIESLGYSLVKWGRAAVKADKISFTVDITLLALWTVFKVSLAIGAGLTLPLAALLKLHAMGAL